MKSVVYSHLYLSLCAISLVAETVVLFDCWNEASITYLIFVFFSTFIAYNVKGMLTIAGWLNTTVHSGKLAWTKANKNPLLIACIIAIVLAAVLAIQLPVESYRLLFPLAFLAILYSLPLRIGGYHLSPRYIPFFKTALVAIVWVIVTVYIPCKINNISITKFYFWLAGEFLFLFSLSILFDVKDIQTDVIDKIKTLPQKLGIPVTKVASLVLMGGRMIWLIMQRGVNLPVLTESLFSFIYLFYMVTLIDINQKEKFYMVWIDGLMVMKVLLFLIVSRV